MPRVVIELIIIALVAWLITAFLPLPQPFATLVYVALVIWAVVVLLRAGGVWTRGDGL